jgi:uncharacterized membrane protein YphA (DoxX/SURF4 family)
MRGFGKRNPRWVNAILDWRGTWVLARVALTGAYLVGGFSKLFDFQAAIAEQARFGLQPVWLWATLAVLVELVAPLLIIFGRFVWLGAGAIAIETAIITFVVNDFWHLQGHARFLAMSGFLEHWGLIGGCVLAALLAEHDQRDRSMSGGKAPQRSQ